MVECFYVEFFGAAGLALALPARSSPHPSTIGIITCGITTQPQAQSAADSTPSLANQLAVLQHRLKDSEAALVMAAQAACDARQEAADATAALAAAGEERSCLEWQLAEREAAACEERAGLQRQLAEREAVIGQLARHRENTPSAARLESYEHARKEAARQCRRAVEGLGAMRQQYSDLAGDFEYAIKKIEAQPDAPCTCCGGSAYYGAALRVLDAAHQAATHHSLVSQWQAAAREAQLELVAARVAADEAAADVRCLRYQLAAAERRAEEAEEALAQEQADRLCTHHKAKQASCLLLWGWLWCLEAGWHARGVCGAGGSRCFPAHLFL
jgi:hypothetical protein